MAKILFRPVRSKCRRELNSVIDYQCIDFRGFEDGIVEPSRCPYCDAWFTCIEIPTRLPFDNIHHTNEKSEDFTEEKIDVKGPKAIKPICKIIFDVPYYFCGDCKAMLNMYSTKAKFCSQCGQIVQW